VFYNNFDRVRSEDRWGMVGKTGDDFRENRLLKVPCYKCHRSPLIIAERNWMATNHDNSQRYQIMVSCEHCGAVDQFIVNDGHEGQISKLKRSQHSVSSNQLI
jgi:hypothetical protein